MCWDKPFGHRAHIHTPGEHLGQHPALNHSAHDFLQVPSADGGGVVVTPLGCSITISRILVGRRLGHSAGWLHYRSENASGSQTERQECCSVTWTRYQLQNSVLGWLRLHHSSASASDQPCFFPLPSLVFMPHTPRVVWTSVSCCDLYFLRR